MTCSGDAKINEDYFPIERNAVREESIKRKFPNLFIPGFPKSGTSSLWAWLRQHPEIEFTKDKSPHYFDADIDWGSNGRTRITFNNFNP